MTLGMSTSCFFTRFETEDAVKEIARIGATCCEVFLSSDYEYDTAYVKALQRIVQGEGLRVSAVHALGSQFEPQLFSAHARQNACARAKFVQLLEDCAILGAPVYVMHGTQRLKRGIGEPRYERLGPHLCALSALADTYGVRLSLENVHYCTYANAGYATKQEPYIKDSNLGYTLDIKQAAQAGEDAFAYLQEMGKRLVNVHICGVTQQDGQVKTSLPNRSLFDFSRLHDALLAMAYDGAVTIEVYPGDFQEVEELRACFWEMKQIFK